MSGRGAGDRRRRGRIGAAIGVTVVVVLGAVGVLGASAARTSAAWPVSAAFLPADGDADWFVTGANAVQREHWVSAGATPLFAFPEQARDLALSGYTEASLEGWHWAVLRTAVTTGTATHAERGMDLYSVSADGIRLVLNIEATGGFSLSPGVLVLDAAAQPAAEWSSEGDAVWAFVGDNGTGAIRYDYRADHTATEPGVLARYAGQRKGCLEVSGRIELRPQGEDAPAIVLEDAALWCPEDGIVAARTSADPSLADVSVVADAPPLAPARVVAPTETDPATWQLSERPATLVHDVYAPTARALSAALEPVVVGDTLVAARANDGGVAFLREIDGTLEEVRLADPGGRITSLAAVDDLAVAVTTERRVVAYRADGLRAWEAELDDIVVAPAVRAPDGTVVIGGRDGAVHAFDPITGEEVWSAAATPDPIAFVEVVGSRIVVVDDSGGLMALAAEDGATAWHVAGDEPDTVTAGDGAIFTVRAGGIERIDAATGRVLWRTPFADGADDIAVVDDRVVVLTWGDVLAVDAESGARLWAAPGGDRLMAVAGGILVDGRGAPRLLDLDGTEVARWDRVPAETLGASRFVAGDASGAWVIDSVAGTYRLAP